MKVIIKKSYDMNNDLYETECNCNGADCRCNDKSTDECTCFEYVPPDDCRVGS